MRRSLVVISGTMGGPLPEPLTQTGTELARDFSAWGGGGEGGTGRCQMEGFGHPSLQAKGGIQGGTGVLVSNRGVANAVSLPGCIHTSLYLMMREV